MRMHNVHMHDIHIQIHLTGAGLGPGGRMGNMAARPGPIADTSPGPIAPAVVAVAAASRIQRVITTALAGTAWNS